LLAITLQSLDADLRPLCLLFGYQLIAGSITNLRRRVQFGEKKIMNYPWVIKDIYLNFRVGVRNLFRKDFRALVLDAHFTALSSDPNQIYLPPENFSQEIEAIMIPSHPVRNDWQGLARSSQMIRYVPPEYNRYYIDLSGDFTQYLNKFSSISRKTLRRTLRKFAEFCGGDIRWHEYRDGQEMAEFYTLARGLSRKTYQERLLNEGLPEGEQFRREMLELAVRGLARGYLLFHGDRPIAYIYCKAQGDVLLSSFGGYDPDYRKWSPGTILDYLSIEKLFAEGRFRLLDLGEGDYEYKQFFSTASVRCADIYYFRPTIRNRSLLRLHVGWNAVLRLGSNSLEKLCLKSRMKRWAKSHAIVSPFMVGYESLNPIMISCCEVMRWL
jgi:CelD/BcsL family acetyltransferase involved in cellulose biosynthesis